MILSHLLNLYSFVIYLYSSSNHFFVSSHLLLPSFFFPPLTRPHEVEEWWLATHFGLFQWPFQSELDLFCSLGSRLRQNWAKSASFSLNQRELGRIGVDWKKKKGDSTRRTLNTTWGRVQCGCSNPGAAPMIS